MKEIIPTGWVKVRLGEIINPSRARLSPKEAGSLRYVGMEHIESNTMRLIGHSEAKNLKSSSMRFNTGDVLYGKMRPYLNKVWVAEFDGLCSAEFFVFPNTEGLNNRLFAYRLNSQDFVDFANNQISGERPRVDFEKLSRFKYLLAPVREQNQILERLHVLLSRIANGELAARRALVRIQKYRTAILRAAVAGELTQEWRSKRINVESGEALLHKLLLERRIRWEESELERITVLGKEFKNSAWTSKYAEPTAPSIFDSAPSISTWGKLSPEQLADGSRNSLSIGPFGSNLKVSDYREEGVPLIFVRNIRSEKFQEKEKFISKEKAEELSSHKAVGGDLLITKMGDPPGDACLYPEEAATAIITADCIRIHIPESLQATKKFFVYYINSIYGREQFQKITNGVAQQKVSLSRFSKIALPLPPLQEQAEIVRQVERRLIAAEKLETVVKRQLSHASEIRQKILHRAFSGGLVNQDPSNEHAIALLDKIQSYNRLSRNDTKVKYMPKTKKLPRRALLDVLREHRKPITPEQLFKEAGFEPSMADSFYRELLAIKNMVREIRPGKADEKSWPHRAQIQLELKGD